MRSILMIIAASLLLTGCVTVSSNRVSVPLAEYTPEFQNQLADELEALPPGSATRQAIDNYGLLREQIRQGQSR